MDLRERINSELKDAMRARDQVKLDTIRSIKTALSYKEVESADAKALDDAGVLKLIQGLIKQRRDSSEQFRAGGRPELAEKEEKEICHLQSFLPTQLSEAEITDLVAATIKEVGATSPKEMGAVMKALQPKIAGRAEGRVVSEAVKKALAGG